MKREVILRWLIKGESDLKSAKILLDAADVLTDIVCFHSQQAVEKYLKAFLTDKDVRFEKIHDLEHFLSYAYEKIGTLRNSTRRGYPNLAFTQLTSGILTSSISLLLKRQETL